MATSAKIAEAAWERVVELTKKEIGRRSDPGRADELNEALTRWHAVSKRQFLSAWRHVSSMAAPECIRKDYAIFLTTPNAATVGRTMEALAIDVSGLITVMRSDDGARTFHDAITAIEAVMIACMGHYSPRPRALAIKLLNSLYDGVDWQLGSAHEPTIALVGDRFVVDAYTTYKLGTTEPEEKYAVLVCGPSFDRVAGAGIDHIVTMHVPTISQEEVWISTRKPSPVLSPEVASPQASPPTSNYIKTVATRIQLSLAPFARCGYFDWRVVVVAADGTCRPVSGVAPLTSREVTQLTADGALPAAPASAQPLAPGLAVAQGRYIVHKSGLREEHFHEVIVDLEGMKFNDNGEIVKHGTFADVAASLRNLKGGGVTSLVVMGALERDNGWGEGESEPREAATPPVRPDAGARSSPQPSDSARSVGGGSQPDSESFGFYPLESDNPPASAAGNGPPRSSSTPFGSIDGKPVLVPNTEQYPAGMRAYAARPDANPHAVVDRHTPNRMLGGNLGFFKLVQEARALGIRVVAQCDAAVSSSRPHRKYRHLYAHTLDTKGQAVVHAGTDCLENQWEDQQLLNYRKVETWDLLVSEVKTLVQNYGVGGLYLPDAQSYPFAMAVDTGEMFRRDVDGELHYSPQEILEGEVVIANSEIGYWSTRAARTYPNPLLVKLTRSLWQIAPDFVVIGESHWGRAGALLRSGVVPHTLDVISAMACTLGRFVDKNGNISSLSMPRDVQPVHFLRALIGGESDGIVPPQAAPQFVSQYLQPGQALPSPLANLLNSPAGAMPRNGLAIQIRSLTSERYPYPALLLGRSAWTGVDLMYSLPGIPMSFQEEKQGRAYRVDVTGTYQYNAQYLEDERKKREKRLVAEKHALKYRHAAATASVSASNNGHVPPPALGRPMSQSSRDGSGIVNSSGSVQSTDPADPLANAMQQLQTPTGSAAAHAGTPTVAAGGANFENWGEGDVGVGGVIPAMPIKGQPAYKIARTGFSSVNLPEMAGASPSHRDSAAVPAPQAAAAPQPLIIGNGPGTSARIGGNGRMTNVASSPALQDLLLRHEDTDSGSLSGRAAADRGSTEPAFDEDEEDDDATDIQEAVAGGISQGSRFGFTVPSLRKGNTKRGASKLRDSWGPGYPEKAAATQTEAVSRAGASNSSDISRVTSWAAMETMTFKGEYSTVDLRDSLKHMAAMESRLRTDVGPQYGFDLGQIFGHYEHRRQLRNRYAVLRDGALTVLTARHRFGEHGNVFSFARHLPGQVAVVAANFNGFSSTIAVDCSPLTAAFGASTTADASASVAELMSASVALGEMLKTRLAPKAAPDALARVQPPLPSLNLKGGVWEVRDIFASDAKWTGAVRFDGTSFSEADGPLVGILSSEEAAYAPMLATLQPHRSYCWLYCAAVGSSTSMRSPKPSSHSSLMLDREAETDPAAMKWLFASSLLRLQAVMRLKECGLSTAVITKEEVKQAGGYDNLLNTRKIGLNERWISPGEALKDEEIQAAARHNLVYSLLRHVAKRACKSILTARKALGPEYSSWASMTGSTADPRLRESTKQIVGDTAVLMEAALRVLITHFQLKEGPSSPGGQEPPRLVANPLPSLHGAMNRDQQSSPTHTHQGDPAWYCIDGDTAVAVCRSALFLAIKDVVAQAANAPSVADVSDDDGIVGAILLKALLKIARGQTAAGAALGTDRSGEQAGVATTEIAVIAMARRLLWTNSASPIVFVTPELGKWSTVGGLGVMVDELSVGLAELGAEVICISPYYNLNRKGVSDYLRADGISYTGRNVSVWVGSERIEVGIHEGRVNDVRLFFIHHVEVFPRPYPSMDAYGQTRVLAAFAKATLELLCQWRLIPNLIVTNDWFTGLVPAYARQGNFGDAFNKTDFMHIAHNLDPDYEGRLWPSPGQGSLQHLHGLPPHFLVDPHWADIVINPTRAALLCSDTWATVSRSYRQDLLESSPLRPLLRLAPHPFAHPNGIPVKQRLQRLSRLPYPTHEEAKGALQKKYFGFEHPDPSLPLFAFVGRITLQKGVHLILQCVDDLLRHYDGRLSFLIGGMASQSDSYGVGCSHKMRELASRHRGRFWANPDMFFTDGDLVNLGADFCLMPSMFEPGGIVQQEFFVASTPVIAFKTGGLKDTVKEFDPTTNTGNGFTFEAHVAHDFVIAIKRAIGVYHNQQQYAQLRANARGSVMDLAVVSLAWFREFHRLRRCMPPGPRKPPAEGLGLFTLRLGEVPGLTSDSTVQVTGSFSGWARKAPLAFVSPDRFEATLSLPPGTYQYKFVVDSVWTTAPSAPSTNDGTGNVNNVITVVPPATALDDDDDE